MFHALPRPLPHPFFVLLQNTVRPMPSLPASVQNPVESSASCRNPFRCLNFHPVGDAAVGERQTIDSRIETNVLIGPKSRNRHIVFVIPYLYFLEVSGMVSGVTLIQPKLSAMSALMQHLRRSACR